MMRVIILTKQLVFWLSLSLLLGACTPPTPPASPTPVPTATSTAAAATKSAATPALTVSKTATPTREPAVLAPPEIINLVVWESLPDAQAQLLAEELAAFQQEFSKFQVSQKHYESSESFMPSLAAGQGSFDLVLASPVLLSSLWSARQLVPISDFVPPSFIDDFSAMTLTGASRDGEIWGLPDTAGFHLLLFYNRDLVETPPTDTDQLVDLAQSLTRQNSGRWGLGVNSYDPLWLVPWLSAYDGWLTDRHGQPDLNSPAMESALALYLSWHGLPNGKPGAGQQEPIAPLATYEEVRRLFLQGDLAMMIDGEWAIVELAGIDAVDWGVAPLPALSRAETSQPTASLVLARYWGVGRSTSGNRALAVAALLEYLTAPERQLAWTEQFGLLPTRRRALNDSLIAGNPALRISAAQMQAGQSVPLGVNTNAILNAMREPLRAALEGGLTVAEAAEMMQRNVE